MNPTAIAIIGPDYDPHRVPVEILYQVPMPCFYVCQSAQGKLVVHKDKLKPLPNPQQGPKGPEGPK